MNTARDHMREDMNKRPEQLQREADDVRSDMEHTVDELANQFSPGALINQAMGMVRGSGDSHFIHNLSTQIQNNPVPALLAGVSLTWLMTASKRPPAQGQSRSSRSGGGMHSAKDKLSSATDHARSSTHQMTQGVKEREQHLVSGTREKREHMAQSASDMKQRLSDGSHHMMDSARTGARSVRDRYDHMLQDQPLMLGALAIAAGAALGALLPRTEAEDRTMGEVSDDQKETVRQRAEEMKERAESKVEETLESQRNPTGTSHQSGAGDQSSSRQQGSDGAATSTSTGSVASTPTYGATDGNTSAGGDGQRRDASSPSTHSQGEATTGAGSVPAGASGPPGSDPAAGSARASDRTSEEGVPAANPSSVPKHPDTNPPILNQRDGDKG